MLDQLCRLCGNKSDSSLDIFSESGARVKLESKIRHVVRLNILQEDPLPKVVCNLCVRHLENASHFIDHCHQTQKYLNQLYEDDTPPNHITSAFNESSVSENETTYKLDDKFHSELDLDLSTSDPTDNSNLQTNNLNGISIADQSTRVVLKNHVNVNGTTRNYIIKLPDTLNTRLQDDSGTMIDKKSDDKVHSETNTTLSTSDPVSNSNNLDRNFIANQSIRRILLKHPDKANETFRNYIKELLDTLSDTKLLNLSSSLSIEKSDDKINPKADTSSSTFDPICNSNLETRNLDRISVADQSTRRILKNYDNADEVLRNFLNKISDTCTKLRDDSGPLIEPNSPAEESDNKLHSEIDTTSTTCDPLSNSNLEPKNYQTTRRVMNDQDDSNKVLLNNIEKLPDDSSTESHTSSSTLIEPNSTAKKVSEGKKLIVLCEKIDSNKTLNNTTQVTSNSCSSNDTTFQPAPSNPENTITNTRRQLKRKCTSQKTPINDLDDSSDEDNREPDVSSDDSFVFDDDDDEDYDTCGRSAKKSNRELQPLPTTKRRNPPGEDTSKKSTSAEPELPGGAKQNTIKGSKYIRKTPKEKKPFQCDTCKKTFSQQLTYEEHLNLHSGNRPFSCKLCTASFRRRQDLNQHLRTIHSENQFKCPSCDFIAKHKGKLTEHVKSVHDKPFACDMCNYRTGEKGKITLHIANKHTDNLSFVCEICGNRFRTKTSLDVHIKNIHHPEPKVCQLCGTVCSSLARYSSHIFYCGKEKRRHTCDKCGKSYVNKEILRDHMNKHMNVKPYKCEVCGKAFYLRNRLHTHRYVHRGANYQCEICNQSFNRKDNMKNHRKRHFYKSMRCDDTIVTAV